MENVLSKGYYSHYMAEEFKQKYLCRKRFGCLILFEEGGTEAVVRMTRRGLLAEARL